MNDEPIFPPGMPDDVKNQIKSQIERNEMRWLDVNHQISGFIGSLDDDQIEALEHLLNMIQHTPEFVGYFVGLVSGIAMARGRCPYCRKVHDIQELADLAEEEAHDET